MPALEVNRHEQFALLVAKGVNATQAYVSAGYAKGGAAAGASRLLKHVKVFARIRELQETISAQVIAAEIASRDARVRALQGRWTDLREKLDSLLKERGADMPDVPGGPTGLLCKDYKGKDATQPVYRIDMGVISIMAELRAHEQQAAQELGQWTEKRELKSAAGTEKSVLPEWLLETLKKNQQARGKAGTTNPSPAS